MDRKDLKRTFDFLEYALQNSPLDDALAVKRNGRWEKFSTDEFKRNADYVSYGLLALGIKKGDKIATVTNNRPEWNFMDMGMSQIGAVHVPIYPTIGEPEYEHILNHSESRLIIVHNKERYDIIKPVVDKAEKLEKMYTFDAVEGAPNYTEIIELGKKNEAKYKDELAKISAAVQEDDLCSIIYTSGTTGLSKGVMMTHKNFVSNVIYSRPAVPENARMAISFLPLNHVFERMLNYLFLYLGIKIYYAESTDKLIENIQEIKPHIFAAVPRVLEKVYDKILMAGMDLSGVKKAIFFWALKLANQYDPTRDQGFIYNKKLAIADKLIFSKWRAVLGGNIIAIVSGGAALQPRLSKVFAAAKIPVLEGYGLSETAPVIAVNRLDNIQPGTVGEILEEAQVKIADDGEILYKGPNLMPGYYNDEMKTSEAIDEDGWFHTGDMGELNGKILKITGRKKELFKLSTGKYVAPQLIENKFKESPFIGQMMVLGFGEKFCAALFCPAFEYLHDWASMHDIHFKSNVDLIKNPKVIERFQEEVDKYNEPLDKHMQIKKFALVCEEWTPETGELSPTLKLKRNIINKKYETRIKYIYGHTDDEGYVQSE